ncbi:MAG: pilin, partial [Patescibacteria group bacterium]
MSILQKAKKQKNKKTMIILVCFLTFLFFIFFVNVSLAAGILPTPTGDKPSSCTSNNCGNYTLNDFVQLGVNVANWILGIVGSLALFFFIYGGVWMIISSGKSEEIQKAKTILTNAIIGLVIVFTSWVIINFTVSVLTGGTTI